MLQLNELGVREMKISGDDPIKTYLKGIQKTEKGVSRKESEKAVASDADRIEISGKARHYQQVNQRISAMPDVRADEVLRIQKDIENGKYRIDEEKIADKMTRSAILDTIL